MIIAYHTEFREGFHLGIQLFWARSTRRGHGQLRFARVARPASRFARFWLEGFIQLNFYAAVYYIWVLRLFAISKNTNKTVTHIESRRELSCFCLRKRIGRYG